MVLTKNIAPEILVSSQNANNAAVLLVDVHAMYRNTLQQRQGKIDYTKYFKTISDHYDIRMARAYCNQNATSFRKTLTTIGFDIKFDKYAFSYHLVLDALELAKNTDTIILGTTNVYVPMLSTKLKEMGKKVVIYACAIPARFKSLGECIEVADTDILPAVQAVRNEESGNEPLFPELAADLKEHDKLIQVNA
jgi:uncharacterized LabA/DUF88 family protein